MAYIQNVEECILVWFAHIVAYGDAPKTMFDGTNIWSATYSESSINCTISILKQENWVDSFFGPIFTHRQVRLKRLHDLKYHFDDQRTMQKRKLCVPRIGCVPVIRVKPLPGLRICLAPIFSNIALSMYERFINHYRKLGVHDVTMYATDERVVPQNTTGVTVVPWPLRSKAKHWHGDGSTFYYAQALAYNDCIHRNRGKVLIFVDLDDLILAKTTASWTRALEKLKHRSPAIKMRWVDFPCGNTSKTCRGDNSSTIWNSISAYSHYKNSKMMIDSKKVEEMGIHARYDNDPWEFDPLLIVQHARARSCKCVWNKSAPRSVGYKNFADVHTSFFNEPYKKMHEGFARNCIRPSPEEVCRTDVWEN